MDEWQSPEWRPLGVIWFSPEAYPFQVLLILGGIFLGWFLCQWIPERHRKYIFSLFTVSYLLRVILCYLLYLLSYGGRRKGAFLGFDDAVYMYNGLGLSRLMEAGIAVDATNLELVRSYSRDRLFDCLGGPFILYNAYLFRWLGNHPLSVLVTNCLLGALIVFPLFFLGKTLFDSRTGRVAATLGVWFPSAFLWSTQDLKEPLFNLLMTLLFLLFSTARKKNNVISLFLAGGVLYAIGSFRPPLHWLCLAGLLLGWIVSDRRARLIAMAAIVIFCVFGMEKIKEGSRMLSARLVVAEQNFTNLNESALNSADGIAPPLLNQLSRLRQNRNTGTTILQSLEFKGWTSLLYLGILIVAITLTAPYPWQIFESGVTLALANGEMILWYCLIPMTCLGIWRGFRKQLPLTVSLLVSLTLFALVMGCLNANVGLLVRQRGFIFLILFVFTGAGIVLKRRRNLMFARSIG